MITLAVLLGAVAVADLCRPRYWVALAVGVATLVALVAGIAPGWEHAAWLLPLGLVVLAVWELWLPTHAWAHRFLIAFVGLGLLALAVPQPSVGDGWLVRWHGGLDLLSLASVPFPTFLLGLAAFAAQLTTANVIVRIVLTWAGPAVIATEQRLQGGRFLGPIERVFLLAMALGGQYGALGAIVAAKGILRFPEISREGADGTAAEYVLVGSFVSWACAFAFVPLL